MLIDAPIYYDKKRIVGGNVKDYLLRKYSNYDSVELSKTCKINMPNLLQKNYGDDMDCSLTSVTECVMYHYKKEKGKDLTAEEVYAVVEEIAKKYFYNGKSYGTIPVFIKNIYDKTLEHFGLSKIKTKQKYFKQVGFSMYSIKEQANKQIPMIFSIFRDGRNYYNDHSITIVGYEDFILRNSKTGAIKNVTMLLVQDH